MSIEQGIYFITKKLQNPPMGERINAIRDFIKHV